MTRSKCKIILDTVNLRNFKTPIVGGSSMLTDQVSCQAPQEMKQDCGLFVRVGIQLDASLLAENAAEVLVVFERVAGEIASVCRLALCFCFQVAWIMPASMPAGVNSSKRVRRLASRWG